MVAALVPEPLVVLLGDDQMLSFQKALGAIQEANELSVALSLQEVEESIDDIVPSRSLSSVETDADAEWLGRKRFVDFLPGDYLSQLLRPSVEEAQRGVLFVSHVVTHDYLVLVAAQSGRQGYLLLCPTLRQTGHVVFVQSHVRLALVRVLELFGPEVDEEGHVSQTLVLILDGAELSPEVVFSPGVSLGLEVEEEGTVQFGQGLLDDRHVLALPALHVHHRH